MCRRSSAETSRTKRRLEEGQRWHRAAARSRSCARRFGPTAMALELDRQAIAFSERHRRGFRFGNTIAFQTRSLRLAWEAHSASDNFLPLAISAATLALSGRPEASVLRIDPTAGSSRGKGGDSS